MNIDFAALFDSSPNPYVVMDPDLRLVWMNQAYLTATMRRREEIIGRKMFEAFPSDPGTDSFRLLDDSLQRVLRTSEADEIALIRYDITAPDGSLETRYWSATHTPLMDDGGKLAFILQHTVDVTELQRLRQSREEANLMRRAEKLQSQNDNLVRESRRLHQFFDQAPGFVAVLGGAEHVFQMANTAYHRLVGRQYIVGARVADALPEVVRQGFIEILDRVYSTGEPYFGRREPVVLAAGPGQSEETRVLNFIFQPIRGMNDDITGIIIQGYDVTDEVAFEERQALLISELQHRVKNAIAVVQALAKQTFKPDLSNDEAVAIFSARLTTLSAAHGLLTEGSWGPTPLRSLLNYTLDAALGEAVDRVTLEGPDHLLDPEAALGLTMLVHELATNAVKYGALSNDRGKVALRWTLSRADEENIAHLVWKETGGPVVGEPTRRGFGTRLIQRGLGSGGGAGADMRFLPEGLECVMDIATSHDPKGAQFGRPFARFKGGKK